MASRKRKSRRASYDSPRRGSGSMSVRAKSVASPTFCAGCEGSDSLWAMTRPALAALTAVLGRSLAAYTAIGAATAAVTTLTLYATVKMTAGRLAAFLAALLFVGLNVTCNIGYGSNFLFPYAHGATFGMTFLLLF